MRKKLLKSIEENKCIKNIIIILNNTRPTTDLIIGLFNFYPPESTINT